MQLEDILPLLETQVIVRLQKSRTEGFLLLFDPRTITVALLLPDHTIRLIHGHAIVSIEPNIYADPIKESTGIYIKRLKSSLSIPERSQESTIDNLAIFLQSKDIKFEKKSRLFILHDGLVTIEYPYLPSCVKSNNHQLVLQHQTLLDEFYSLKHSELSNLLAPDI